MRMTNKIMQNNSLYNINNNKLLQDKLSTQMSTQKKITRPSDDPVIAIRALRLRTNVSELTQFYGKNAPDAESWLTVTGKALSTVADVLTELSREANKGSNKEKGVDDLKIIAEQLKSLKDEFYSTGNMDYAGRYVFTGYRTTTPLSFTDEVEQQEKGYPSYDIKEQTNINAFDTINYTNVGGLGGLNKHNYTDPKYNGTGAGIVEQDVKNGDIHRLCLSYDNVKSGADVKIEIMDKDKKPVNTIIPTEASLTGAPSPYDQLLDANEAKADLAIFVPETGEILISDSLYSQMEKEVGNVNTDGSKTEIRVSYTKDEWKKGDLRPEHYFACTGKTKDAAGKEKTVLYNQDYLTEGKSKSSIEYDVGYNQKIEINTTADEVFTHSLDRDMDDLDRALEELAKIDASQQDLKNIMKELEAKNIDETDPEYIRSKNLYDATKKSYDYIRENVHSIFERTISDAQGYLDDANVAITDNGTRGQRLDLISNRLMDQKTTFQTLQSENEDADIAEVAIQLTSTELTYNAALMATGKIMQTSLMNYI